MSGESHLQWNVDKEVAPNGWEDEYLRNVRSLIYSYTNLVVAKGKPRLG